MKILIVSSLYSPYIGGGAEVSTQLLAEGLKKYGLEVEVLTSGLQNENVYISGVNVKRRNIGLKSKKILSGISKYKKEYKFNVFQNILFKLTNIIDANLLFFFYNEIKNNKYEIIHTSNNMNNFGLFMCWFAAKKLKIEVVHTLRDPVLLCYRVDLDNKHSIFDRFYRAFSKIMIKDIHIHSPSQYMLNLHEKYGFVFNYKKVIPNTVNNIDCVLNYGEKGKYIVYVGTISNNKGIKTLLNAFNSLNRHDYKLILIGDGELLEELKNQNNNRIELLGWKSTIETQEYIKKSMILVLPSEWDEAFGRTLIEAVNCKTLPIGSNRGAIPEVLGYNSKYIFESKNSNDLKNKIERIIGLSAEEYKNEIEILEKYMKKFSLEEHCVKFRELYTEIIEKK